MMYSYSLVVVNTQVLLNWWTTRSSGV